MMVTVAAQQELDGVVRAESNRLKAVLAEKSVDMVASVERSLRIFRGPESDTGTS